jgi:hypothetical protein
VCGGPRFNNDRIRRCARATRRSAFGWTSEHPPAGADLAVTVRTLPIRLAPLPGEGLDSYLEALAHRGGVVWADMLTAVGLSTGCCDSAGMYRWLTDLTDTQVDTVSCACGVSPAAVRAMTIGQAIPAGMAMAPGRSRFCPHCLTESGGRWQLWWRHRWAFACTRHHCLLADNCPRCGRCPRGRALPRGEIPDPGRCASLAEIAHHRGRRRCGSSLSTASTLHLGEDHRALAAQSTIVTAIRDGVITDGVYRTTAVAAQQFLTDMAQLSSRMHGCAGLTGLDHGLPVDLVRHYCSRTTTGTQYRDDDALPGVTAPSTAIAAVLATDILLCPDIATAAAGLRPWIAASQHHGHRPTVSSTTRNTHASSALRSVELCALAPFLPAPLRHHVMVSATVHCDVALQRWRHIPAVIWPEVAHILSIHASGGERWGAALSVALCLVGTPATLPEVVARLGSATTAASVSHILRTQRADHRWPHVYTTLTSVAEELDAHPCPIDYAARRTLPFVELLPRPQWRDIRCTANLSAVPEIAYRLAQCWVFGQITGSPPRQCPSALHTADFGRLLAALPVLVSAELSSTLDQVARQFLDAHGHGHEPLRWHPSIR